MILFCGDSHGQFDHLIEAVQAHRPAAVILLGDMQAQKNGVRRARLNLGKKLKSFSLPATTTPIPKPTMTTFLDLNDHGNPKYLVCKGDTYPALLMYQELADMACNKITAAINRQFLGERPIKALLDAYNPTGSTAHVRFNTSKTVRWETSSKHCHLNWVILDSDWEAEFCRVAESHPKVLAYVKNHNLGLEVPYRFGSVMRKYLPDFIVLIDDGHGAADPLHLVVEIKGYRGEDAIEKKSTMDTYWVPGVNHLGSYGRWAFAEFTEVYQIESDFKAKVESEFNKLIDGVAP